MEMDKTYQLIIKGGMVVGPGGINRTDLGIKDGKIARLASKLRSGDAGVVLDGTGKYILPGLFDVHVHPVYVDTIEDCSVLGAFGGITTMIHYAYAKPGTGLAETVRRFIEEGKETSHTDFAVHGAMFDAKNQIADIPACF
jgi:dihydroorotase-like cyclic amidohydrolase